MKAHLFKTGRGYRFSGFNSCGDPFDGAGDVRAARMKPRPFDAIVDVGDRGFILTGERDRPLLYLLGPGPGSFQEFTPGMLVHCARQGAFGFTLTEQ